MIRNFFLAFWLVIVFVIPSNGQHTGIKKGKINAGNLQVYYERHGRGEALLLLHAGLQDHTMWNEQVKALSGQYEIITADLPHHGLTTGNDTTLLAQELIKILLDSLHLQKVSVAGLSMGAAVALDFIIAYPQRVNKGILISAGINGYEKKYPIDSVSMDWYIHFKDALAKKDSYRPRLSLPKPGRRGCTGEGIA